MDVDSNAEGYDDDFDRNWKAIKMCRNVISMKDSLNLNNNAKLKYEVYTTRYWPQVYLIRAITLLQIKKMKTLHSENKNHHKSNRKECIHIAH